MITSRTNEDGTRTERHSLYSNTQATDAIIAELNNAAGTEIISTATVGQEPYLEVVVTYSKPVKGSAREAVEKFCELGAYADWKEHQRRRQLALTKLHIDTASGHIEQKMFLWLVNMLMESEARRAAYERGGAGI